MPKFLIYKRLSLPYIAISLIQIQSTTGHCLYVFKDLDLLWLQLAYLALSKAMILFQEFLSPFVKSPSSYLTL